MAVLNPAQDKTYIFMPRRINSLFVNHIILLYVSWRHAIFFFFSDDKNLCLDCYKLISGNRPKNVKQVGFCRYFRETLLQKIIDIKHLLVCQVVYDCEKNFSGSLFYTA